MAFRFDPPAYAGGYDLASQRFESLLQQVCHLKVELKHCVSAWLVNRKSLTKKASQLRVVRPARSYAVLTFAKSQI